MVFIRNLTVVFSLFFSLHAQASGKGLVLDHADPPCFFLADHAKDSRKTPSSTVPETSFLHGFSASAAMATLFSSGDTPTQPLLTLRSEVSERKRQDALAVQRAKVLAKERCKEEALERRQAKSRATTTKSKQKNTKKFTPPLPAAPAEALTEAHSSTPSPPPAPEAEHTQPISKDVPETKPATSVVVPLFVEQNASDLDPAGWQEHITKKGKGKKTQPKDAPKPPQHALARRAPRGHASIQPKAPTQNVAAQAVPTSPTARHKQPINIAVTNPWGKHPKERAPATAPVAPPKEALAPPAPIRTPSSPIETTPTPLPTDDDIAPKAPSATEALQSLGIISAHDLHAVEIDTGEGVVPFNEYVAYLARQAVHTATGSAAALYQPVWIQAPLPQHQYDAYYLGKMYYMQSQEKTGEASETLTRTHGILMSSQQGLTSNPEEPSHLFNMEISRGFLDGYYAQQAECASAAMPAAACSK